MEMKMLVRHGAGILLVGGWLSACPVMAHAAEIDVGEVFFELNHTDGDLGVHGTVDADPWRHMMVFNHLQQLLFELEPRFVLGWEGVTEFSFESAEPTFDRLAPAEFFRRYPEGNYRFVGFSLWGERMDRLVAVSHLLPAPPVTFVNNVPAAEDCDAELPEFSGDDVVIHWEPVTHSHPEIGRLNEPMVIASYEVIVEVPDSDWKAVSLLPADATSFEVPDEILELAEEGLVKYEIIARGENRNKTAVESCFIVEL